VSVPRNYLDRPVAVIGAGTLARRIALMFATRGGLVRIHARNADRGTRRWTRSSNNATNCRKPIPMGTRPRRIWDLLTFPWVGSTASIGHFWAAADAAGRSLTCPLPAQRVHRGSRVKGGRRPSQRDALAPLTREGCTRRRRGPDLHARTGTQSRCSEIDPRKRHKSRD
jgi:hypothetical protein